jgi:hypothetical protein
MRAGNQPKPGVSIMLNGKWQGIAEIYRWRPSLDRRNWYLNIQDDNYSEVYETVRDGHFQINIDIFPQEINMNFGFLVGDKGIFKVENEKLTINYGENRPVDFGDLNHSHCLVLNRSNDSEWSPLRNPTESIINGSWRLESMITHGIPIDINKWGIQTYVFGRDEVLTRHITAEMGTISIDTAHNPWNLMFMDSYGTSEKREFWFKDGLLFVSSPGSMSDLRVYKKL